MDVRPDPIALYDEFLGPATSPSREKPSVKREIPAVTATTFVRMRRALPGRKTISRTVQKTTPVDEDERTNTTSATLNTSGSDTASSNSLGSSPTHDKRHHCASDNETPLASPQGDLIPYQNSTDEEDDDQRLNMQYNDKTMIRRLLTSASDEGLVDAENASLSDSSDVIPLFMTDADALDETSFARGLVGYLAGTEFPVICHTICKITEDGSEEALTDDDDDDFDVMTREKWDALHSPQRILNTKSPSRSQEIHRPKGSPSAASEIAPPSLNSPPPERIITKCPSEPSGSIASSNDTTEEISRSASEGSGDSSESGKKRPVVNSLPPSPRPPSPIKERNATENTLPTIIDMMDEELDGILPEYKWRQIEHEQAKKEHRPEMPFEPTRFEI